MINERDLRKPTFDEVNSTPVTLGDNQAWFLPKPWVETRPRFRKGKVEATVPVASLGTEFYALREAVKAGAASESQDEFVTAAMNLAAYLLLFNYDLADEQLDEVLTLPHDAARTWITDVMAVAHGSAGLKASSGGDA